MSWFCVDGAVFNENSDALQQFENEEELALLGPSEVGRRVVSVNTIGSKLLEGHPMGGAGLRKTALTLGFLAVVVVVAQALSHNHSERVVTRSSVEHSSRAHFLTEVDSGHGSILNRTNKVVVSTTWTLHKNRRCVSNKNLDDKVKNVPVEKCKAACEALDKCDGIQTTDSRSDWCSLRFGVLFRKGCKHSLGHEFWQLYRNASDKFLEISPTSKVSTKKTTPRGQKAEIVNYTTTCFGERGRSNGSGLGPMQGVSFQQCQDWCMVEPSCDAVFQDTGADPHICWLVNLERCVISSEFTLWSRVGDHKADPDVSWRRSRNKTCRLQNASWPDNGKQYLGPSLAECKKVCERLQNCAGFVLNSTAHGSQACWQIPFGYETQCNEDLPDHDFWCKASGQNASASIRPLRDHDWNMEYTTRCRGVVAVGNKTKPSCKDQCYDSESCDGTIQKYLTTGALYERNQKCWLIQMSQCSASPQYAVWWRTYDELEKKFSTKTHDEGMHNGGRGHLTGKQQAPTFLKIGQANGQANASSSSRSTASNASEQGLHQAGAAKPTLRGTATTPERDRAPVSSRISSHRSREDERSSSHTKAESGSHEKSDVTRVWSLRDPDVIKHVPSRSQFAGSRNSTTPDLRKSQLEAATGPKGSKTNYTSSNASKSPPRIPHNKQARAWTPSRPPKNQTASSDNTSIKATRWTVQKDTFCSAPHRDSEASNTFYGHDLTQCQEACLAISSCDGVLQEKRPTPYECRLRLNAHLMKCVRDPHYNMWMHHTQSRVRWDFRRGVNCYAGQGAAGGLGILDGGTESSCKELCFETIGCEGFVIGIVDNRRRCWFRSGVRLSECVADATTYDMWWMTA